MNSEAGSSQESQSILAPGPHLSNSTLGHHPHSGRSLLGSIPASRASPDFLDPESPENPEIQNPWDERENHQPESEIYTENEHNQIPNVPINIDDEASNEPPVYEMHSPEVRNRGEDSREPNDPEVSDESDIRIDMYRFNNDDSSSSLFTIRYDNAIELPSPQIVDAEAQTVDRSNSNSVIDKIENRKRHSEGEPPSKVLKLSKSDDTDGETCPICLDTWGNSGEHRLVALKCGHLFGSNCVQRWLKAQPVKDRSCPTCKRKCQIKDIRHIYAKKLVAADTSQITLLQKQIDDLQAEKCRVELELQKSRIAHRACMSQLEVLRSTLMRSQVPKEQQVRKSWRFSLEKNLEICKDGGCRVLTYNCRTYELYVSQKSSNYLFPGYGIRKVSCVDYKLGQFVHLHPKAIRDITYSQPKDLLLSVGLDSSARVVERGILNVTVQSGVPLWSCSWDYLRGNEFYVGGVGGVIQQYDIRNPNNYIQRLQAPSDMSPVVSLCSTEFGLLSCQLNSCWLWVQNGSRQWEPRALPLDGPFMSLCYDNESHRALVSCRPGPNGERSRLSLCKLKTSVPSGEVLIDTESTFMGSTRSSLMSRATFVKAPSCNWIAAHSESDAALFLHGLDGVGMSRLPSAEPALDVASVQLNGDTLVASLSESRLRLYKAVSTNS